ncbi:MAG: hypothetical protein JW869_05195 [Candidatus Omnitrophica bacterium]|nr:hypothetical protein [Candidatus Omnitrophota bacterium]
MKKNCRLFVLFIFLATTICGCASYREAQKAQADFEQIKLGMTKGQVIDIMGMPQDQEMLVLESGSTVEALRFNTNFRLGILPLGRRQIPVCLQDGEVIGWGKDFYKNKKRESELLFP